jgi:hypothetical protein
MHKFNINVKIPTFENRLPSVADYQVELADINTLGKIKTVIAELSTRLEQLGKFLPSDSMYYYMREDHVTEDYKEHVKLFKLRSEFIHMKDQLEQYLGLDKEDPLEPYRNMGNLVD